MKRRWPELSEEKQKRIITIYNGQGESLKSAALKASDELGEEITAGCVHSVLERNRVPRKKQGSRRGVSHEGHFHGGTKYQVCKSPDEEMTIYITSLLDSLQEKNIYAYKHVNASFKEKYGKKLQLEAFESIATGYLNITKREFWDV